MNYSEVVNRLRRLGCVELPRKGGGSHRKWHNPKRGTVAPVPDWGNKDLKMGTIRSVIRILELDWEEFRK